MTNRNGLGRGTAVLLAAAGLGLSGAAASAQTAKLEPFGAFFNRLSTAAAGDYVGKPASPLTETSAFEEMRRHVVGLYSGVTVKHSYLLGPDTFDCIPIGQQPSVRQLNLTSVASPPPFDLPTAGNLAPLAPSHPVSTVAQVDPSQTTDPLGNRIGCADGSIPMRRVTLERMAAFKSLSAFFQKGPGGAGQIPDPTRPNREALPAVAQSHKYAHSYQYVTNIGGTSDMALWNPVVKTSLGEVFSLSQFWYANTTSPIQTIEGGLQNYPQKYGTTNTVLFIYWTSDGYNKVGCYNLDCAGFVQTNKNVHLGGGFSAYSSDGGSQQFVTLGAYLYQGNWWIYVGGNAASNAVGYYPGAVYHGRPMTKGASQIDYGGEVVGTTIWPPMGSGKFAATGYGHSSYQKNISYYPNSSSAIIANLTVEQPSPSCFTDLTHDSSGVSSWNTYFYFGGPGGTGC